jgi:hypothetical protein
MSPDVTLLAISIEPMSNGKYLTIIRFLNGKNKADEVNRIDLFLQGAEEFVREFRIKHYL